MKRVMSIIIIMLVLIIKFDSVYANQIDDVSVKLPEFKIIINDVEYNNDYSRYPLIIYNDITYFPMTYYDCRFLGLETEWKSLEEGLYINKTGISGTYNPSVQNTKNYTKYKASIVNFPISINDKSIDNSKESYPLLVFRDVTYFPMTWHYCVDEFGWTYSYDNESGLNIKSVNSAITQLGELTNLSLKYNEPGTLAINSKYVYYQGADGKIFQSPLDDLSKYTEVFQLPFDRAINDYCLSTMKVENDKVLLYYYKGNYEYDIDCCYMLTDDGKAIAVDADYKQYDYENISFKVQINRQADVNNLFMKASADDKWINIGDDSLKYLCNSQVIDYYSYSCMYNDDSFYYDGNEYVYIIASENTDDKINYPMSSIYRVNINNNETIKISDADYSIDSLEFENGYLYYHKGYIRFSRYNLITQQNEIIPEYLERGSKYDICFTTLNNTIYICDRAGGGNFFYFMNVDDGVISHLDGNSVNMSSMKLTGDNNEYIVCTFIENERTIYRIVIMDRNRNIIFKTADVSYAKNITIINKTLYFYDYTINKVCSYDLK